MKVYQYHYTIKEAQMATVEATYTGEPCNMCDGEWCIKINGINVSDKIPDEVRKGSMDTLNIYSYFNGSDEEDLEEHEGGHCEEEWIKINKYWLDTICTDKNVQQEIFREIQKNEFTGCGTCGGCV